jgi:hypothetical protein
MMANRLLLVLAGAVGLGLGKPALAGHPSTVRV